MLWPSRVRPMSFPPLVRSCSNPSLHAPPKIDVLVLYTEEAWHFNGMSEPELLGAIGAALWDTNHAMDNSNIDLNFNRIDTQQVSAGMSARVEQHGK